MQAFIPQGLKKGGSANAASRLRDDRRASNLVIGK
jgi:hypothetical protein